MVSEGPYSARPRRLRWPLVAGLVLLHAAALYGLAHAFAPDITAAVERQVVAAFDIAAPEPAPPPPPENRSEPEEGAAGAPGREAVAKPVAAQIPQRRLKEDVALPRASSTGTATQSGGAAAGEGTGAAGTGTGTGSGNGGNGRGGVAVSKPVHISGSIDNARDFPVPPGGRAARRGTQVIVRVTVTPEGRARDCAIVRPSPDPEADRITCRLVETRLGFRPAMDENGNPVAAPFYWRQQWF
ncbi:TonB family protein [Erythrobacter sp. CCH5-A1]|jgi:protein TonB|uniref:TonB family protein n=1 Tax=Erythrobacter sp. CCH5-A1 TaxID=1768792 RepID=UPI0008309DCD|nr:TonB family protein [Erythrobacter sp. CCH5-A1]